jgi:hypothetical protein
MDSRPALNLGSVLLAIVVIAGLGVYLPLHFSYRSDGKVAADKSVKPDKSQKTPPASPSASVATESVAAADPSALYSANMVASQTGSEAASAEPVQEPVATSLSSSPGESPTPLDLQQSSWEAPFDAAYWNSSGWKFDTESMTSSGEESSALFRRTYVHFMLECQVEPLADVAEPLRVHLEGRQPKSVMTLAIDAARLIVTDDSHAGATVIKEESISAGPATGAPGRLKLAATGNRLIVTWNGTAALTCNQLAGQSGRPIRFEFASGRTPWRIRELRIEGE